MMSESSDDENDDIRSNNDESSDDDDVDIGGGDDEDVIGLLDPQYQIRLAGGNVSISSFLCAKKLNSIRGGQSDESFRRELQIDNEAFGTNIPVDNVMRMFSEMEEKNIIYKFFCKTCGLKVCTSAADKMSDVRGKSYDCGTADCKLTKVDLTGNTSDVLSVLDIGNQLEAIFNLPNISEMLEPLDTVHSRPDGVMTDIYDGEVYKRIVKDLRPEDIVLLHSSDGLQIFQKDTGSVWSDLYEIANLKLEYRQKPELMICGSVIYCKKGSPPKEFFEEHLEETMDKIKSLTVQWEYENIGKQSKVVLGNTIEDLPARSKVMKCPFYNAYGGCTHCHIEGVNLSKGAGSCVYYPANEEENLSPKTDEEVRGWGEEADMLNRKVHGYSGSCAFSKVDGFDLVEQVVVDSMHCLYEGVMSGLMKQWLAGSAQDEWNLKPYIEILQDRLDRIHLTSESTRSTLKLSEWRNWKANQLRTMVLIGPTVLVGILEEEYFNHFCKLSAACHLLENDTITPADLQRADVLLLSFWRDFPYGDNTVTMNIHAAGFHIPDSVRNFGPLPNTSMFPYENVMQVFKKYVCGTVGVSSQLGTKWNLVKSLMGIGQRVNGDNICAKNILEIAQGVKKLVDPIVTPFHVVMSSNKRQTKRVFMNQTQTNILRDNCDANFRPLSEAIVSSKIRISGHTLTSKRYKEGRGKKKCDAAVMVKVANAEVFAVIDYFITPIETSETFCVVSLLEELQGNNPDSLRLLRSEAKHCFYMKWAERPPIACRLSDVVGKCILVQYPPSYFFVIKVPSLRAFE